jgi:hypothetical protein
MKILFLYVPKPVLYVLAGIVAVLSVVGIVMGVMYQ